MEVKICGLCRPGDAAAAVAAGADYLGVILSPGRPRSRSLDEAAQVLAAGGAARRVGVFVNEGAEEIRLIAERLGLAVLQLHGAEPPDALSRLREPGAWEVWKAVRPRSGGEFLAALDAYGAVSDGLLLDGWHARAPGGAGARFPWTEVARLRDRLPPGMRLVVAGGLTAANVAAAVSLLLPDVVDVSSGVERQVGQKEPELMRAFVAAARAAAGSGAAGRATGAGES
ncbi:MAG: phosphoribosylanthranilate isomerase [Gemmatimonadetes bacterium]|nr:phosphoribosylanthranilate isomerase [Gemmatimonadota bacterium]